MKLFRKDLKKIYLFLFSFYAISSIAQNCSINNYQRYFATGKYNEVDVCIIRSYVSLNKHFYIAVDFNDLKTYIIPTEKVIATSKTWEEILSQYENTAYIKAVNFAKQQSSQLQDAGIQHGYSNEKGIALTIDLCPSHKPLDRVIFKSIAEEFKKMKTPEPIALSITGRFLNSHPDDIQWLKEMIKSGMINIIWINHTYNHKYDPKLPLQKNFLLEPNTSIEAEILTLEKSLLENKILFSAFFRFPGLVSDSSLVDEVTNYGLIPIGSDAWLAKGQNAKNGDIVLIHGNGNEPLGVNDFLKLLKKEKGAILNKEWLLYDLRENIEEEFEKK
ncbi:MAG TPA: polysaccharide deacetylase [Flavobacterium sp.]|uniref:polysaccharide deacetylase family protein n=1 Tax=Flavobacterium sp. TaxID=239 RepID=UPI002C752DF3|nr:polysaccharide deacetylase [Flavobacterium sp.]HNP33212.1 polysaccharide deacetylase [Flavobacterium sp.]